MTTVSPNERRLLGLIDAATGQAIFRLDPGGVITICNHAAEQILQFSRAEVIGRSFSCLFTEGDQTAGTPAEILQQAREAGRLERELPLLRGHECRFWASMAVQAMEDQAGQLDGFAVTLGEVTAPRSGGTAMLEAEDRFRLLVQSVTDYGLFMLDPDGRVRTWNKGAERLKGYTTEEIIGEHFSRFYTEEDCAAEEPAKVLEEATQHGSFAAESWRVRKDGSRFRASVVIDAIRDEAGELVGFAKITRDITERLRMQQDLEQAREQLFQAQKLEAIGNLTGGVAHDFNNLLTIIRGSIDLAERHAAGNARLKSLLAAVQAAAGRAADLTHQLLAFSRRQPLRPELINLPKQLVEVAGFLDRSLREDIKTTLDVPIDLWLVEIDPRQFELALLNVGLNARDAMPTGGTLRISARNCTMNDRRLGLIGDFVSIAISDEGVGIPQHLLEKVIEPFFTTKEVGKGSGLGLSQAFGFAQQSGGTLAIESKFSEGTTVRFYLPAKTGVASPHKDPAAENNADTSFKGSVLLVEDDAAIAELAALALQDSGYTVALVHCAKDALERLDRAEHFDLVFTDIIMPGRMNGVELAQVIRTRYPRLPVLLTTGYSEAAVSDDAQRFPIITKPYQLTDLAARIARMVKRDDSRPH